MAGNKLEEILQFLGQAKVPDIFPGPISGVSLFPNSTETVASRSEAEAETKVAAENLKRRAEKAKILRQKIDEALPDLPGLPSLPDIPSPPELLENFTDTLIAALSEPVATVTPEIASSESPLARQATPQASPQVIPSVQTPAFSASSAILGRAQPRGGLNIGDVPGPVTTARDALQPGIERLLTSLAGEDDRTPPTFFEKLQPILGGIAQGVAGANTTGSGGVARVLAAAGAGASVAHAEVAEDEKEFQQTLKDQKRAVEQLRLNLKLREAGTRDAEEFEQKQAQHQQDVASANFAMKTFRGDNPKPQRTLFGWETSSRLPDGRWEVIQTPSSQIIWENEIRHQQKLELQGAKSSGKGLALDLKNVYRNDPEGLKSVDLGRRIIKDNVTGPLVRQLGAQALRARMDPDTLALAEFEDQEGLLEAELKETEVIMQFIVSEVEKLQADPAFAGLSEAELIEAVLQNRLNPPQEP